MYVRAKNIVRFIRPNTKIYLGFYGRNTRDDVSNKDIIKWLNDAEHNMYYNITIGIDYIIIGGWFSRQLSPMPIFIEKWLLRIVFND